MGKIPAAINQAARDLGGEAGKALKNAFKGKDGSELTKEDLDQLKQEGYLQKAWEALGAEGQKAFASEDDFYAQMNDTVIATAETAYAQAVDLSTKAGIEVMSGIGVEAARGYAEKMRDVFLASGE
jgi:hypothetical protein